MSTFIFDSYEFNQQTGKAAFHYKFDDGRHFDEVIQFDVSSETYDIEVLERVLFLAFVTLGASYFKTFPTNKVEFQNHRIDENQAAFFNKIYTNGLSQFAFENDLTRDDLAKFVATTDTHLEALPYETEGRLVLQSGGKDSLLTARILGLSGIKFVPWYLSSSDHHPAVLDQLGQALQTATRYLDHPALIKAKADGAKNGHVPVTYMVQSLALAQAVLNGNNEVLVSIAHEGEEPHAMIGDLPVTHQWSKTWEAEQLFQDYIHTYISPDLKVGSPLRQFSELFVAELFVSLAWDTFGHSFSSCNRANYKQGVDNSELHWCGDCPKCANSYILFAPFLAAEKLKELFNGQDLFEKPSLQETFKGLLGIDGVMKPFECVGEINELRYAYGLSQAKGGYGSVSFAVPATTFDYKVEYPSQPWARYTA